MSKVPSIVPISDLREDAANILSKMKNSHEPVVITQRGRAAAVMVSIEEYERSTHEREILRLLAQGDREVAAGKGYELEDVFKEADRILAKCRSASRRPRDRSSSRVLSTSRRTILSPHWRFSRGRRTACVG